MDRVRVVVAVAPRRLAEGVVRALDGIAPALELRAVDRGRPAEGRWDGAIVDGDGDAGGLPCLALGVGGLPFAAEVPALGPRECALFRRFVAEFVERLRTRRRVLDLGSRLGIDLEAGRVAFPRAGGASWPWQLLLSEKMASLAELAGGLSHEIRNPLQTIQNALENIREVNAGREGDIDRNAEIAMEEVDRANDLLDTLFDFVRFSEPGRGEEDVNRALRRVLKLLARELGNHGIEIRADFGCVPRCRVNREGLHVAFLNLIQNARDAMAREGGLLEVRTGLAGGDTVEVVIRDTGRGMTPDVRARAFEPFFTTKPPGRGTGLGLSVARAVVQGQGGRLEIDSAPGRGTAVRLTFPATRSSEAGVVVAERSPEG